MPDTIATVRTCPDCGGILQSVEPEHLTPAEVSRERLPGDPPPAPCQCLLCGYEEPLVTAAVATA